MKNDMHIFFFSLLILFIPSYSEGMKTMHRMADDLIVFLSRHSGMTAVVALGLVYMSDYGEESDSEEFYNWPIPQKKEENLLKIKEESVYKTVEQVIKKPEEKQSFLKEEADDSEYDISMFAQLFPMGLLYELSS